MKKAQQPGGGHHRQPSAPAAVPPAAAPVLPLPPPSAGAAEEALVPTPPAGVPAPVADLDPSLPAAGGPSESSATAVKEKKPRAPRAPKRPKEEVSASEPPAPTSGDPSSFPLLSTPTAENSGGEAGAASADKAAKKRCGVVSISYAVDADSGQMKVLNVAHFQGRRPVVVDCGATSD
jgi:hypothetical protein